MEDNEKKKKDDTQKDKDQKKDLNDEKQKSLKDETEQLEALLEVIKAVEAEKKKKGGKPPRKRRNFIAIEFGGAFHHNAILNFLMNYVLNLTVIYSTMVLFGFGTFDRLVTVILFVLAYTTAETFFRAYILMNHLKIVLQTIGFIFYFGYLTLFYLIDVFLFPNSVRFLNETFLVVFVGMFIVFRYVITQLIKNVMTIRLR